MKRIFVQYKTKPEAAAENTRLIENVFKELKEKAPKGVGYMTFYYWEVLNPEKMYAGLVVVMILGVILTYGLQWLQRRLMPWER